MITIKEVLTDQDAALVEKIPLSRISTPDQLIWLALSVRSTYYEARRVLGRDMVERAYREKIWSRIWMTRIAPKIKYCMWRVVQDVIPTKMNL